MSVYQRLVLKALAKILIGVSEILNRNSSRTGMDYLRIAGEIDTELMIDKKQKEGR